MKQIIIKKGHDLKIKGCPDSNNVLPIAARKVSISPKSFRGVKPKLLVNEGDIVSAGFALFFDKLKPDVRWGAPASGKVSAIEFGPRRVINKIEIHLDDVKPEPYKFITDLKLSSASNKEVLDCFLKANIFPLIRQRPFNKVADPGVAPRDIFISAYNTSPLSVDLSKLIEQNQELFQIGLNAISKLTTGNVYLASAKNTIDFENVENYKISGPHPAGNVGIQIHHIKPIKPGEIIWTVNAQHVITIGRLFKTGIYDSKCIVSIGGSGATNPRLIEVKSGANIQSILKNQSSNKAVRIISGDVYTGTSVNLNDYLGYYDTTISIINDEVKRPFLGMLAPGSTATKYSLTNTFFSFNPKEFNFTTSQNGELRAMVPLNAWEKVLPMDIFPNPLYRAILAEDFEEMEKLGIWECDDEDFALCSFACPSKIDVGGVIRKGLDLLEAES